MRWRRERHNEVGEAKRRAATASESESEGEGGRLSVESEG